MIRKESAAARLSRRAFVSGAVAATLAGAGRPASATEQLVNNVRIEDGGWLLPGWETLTDADDAGVHATLDLIAETAAALTSKSIGLLVVAIPFKARYCDTLAPGEIAPAVATRYARALDAMRARGLATVDLDAALRLAQRPDAPLFYRTDQHWTATAVTAAGKAIALEIAAHWGVPANASREPDGTYIVEKHIGDLTTLLPAALQTQIGLETYRLRSAYDGDLTGYNMFTGALPEADRPPAVQLVGSSFVRPMWGLPQQMTAVLGDPVGLTFFNGDAGPYHALLMNLRSTLPKRRPRVVVWQLTEANLHLGPAATGWWGMADLMSPDFFLSHVREAVNSLG